MLQVWPGDICILGSDGLFDNVSDDEILAEVSAIPFFFPPSPTLLTVHLYE